MLTVYRPQHLREIIIPLLRAPPPQTTDQQKEACALLLQCIDSKLCFKKPQALGIKRPPAARNVRKPAKKAKAKGANE